MTPKGEVDWQRQRRCDLQLGVLRDRGRPLAPGARVLDVGCGIGETVRIYLERGYDAFGCDLAFDQEGPHTAALRAEGRIRKIEDPYRLPFDDATFDFVASDQVLEHVQDYPATLGEIRRVLRPGGTSLHIFPSRYRPIEPHIHVPLATVLQGRAWMTLWAALGVGFSARRRWPAREGGRWMHERLSTRTNYLTKAQIRRHAERWFGDVRFIERDFLKYTPRGPLLYRLSAALPFLPALFSTFYSRVLWLSDGRPGAETGP